MVGRDFVPAGLQGPKVDDHLVAAVGDVVIGDGDDEGI